MPPVASSADRITIARPAPRSSEPVRVLRARGRTRVDWVRLGFAVLLFGIALLTALPAPIRAAWLVGLVAGEGGHWLAPVALLTLVPGWRASAPGRIAGVLGIAAAFLFAMPAMLAFRMSHAVSAEVSRAFGPTPWAATAHASRTNPVELLDLYTGVPIGDTRVRTLTFATRDAEELRLDLHTAAQPAGPSPLLIIVHGGSWRTGDRTELDALARYFAARGVAVAMPDYRLAPDHRFPAARDDVIAATAFLRARAADLGLDASRVAYLGRSAGAQLAISAAVTAAGDPAVRGVVSLYGPLDLRWGYANPGNPRVLDGRAALRGYLGGTPDEVPQQYDDASPVTGVDPRMPPVLMIHGARDDLVSPVHTERFAARMEWAGQRHLALILPWATHGCDAILRGPCGQITLYAVERFLGDVLR